MGVISEVLSLWDAISSVSLQPGVEDSMPKRFSGDGNYSAKSAYDALQEMITFSPWERIWKLWAPGKCRFFMWLVARDKLDSGLACKAWPPSSSKPPTL